MALKTEKFCLDFVGIGAARSGTTWLAQMLGAHPDIFIPPQKELRYFNRNERNHRNLYFDKPLEWYVAFFKAAKSHQLKGEITPAYLHDKHAARKIYNFNPDIKILVVLRNPVDRLFSEYLSYIQHRRISLTSFIKNNKILGEGLYYKHLKIYFDLFSRERIKVAFYDDLIEDNISFLKDIQDFLEVKSFIPQTVNKRFNMSPNPRNLFLPIVTLISRIESFFRKRNITANNRLVKHLSLNLSKTKWFFRNVMAQADQKPQMGKRVRNVLINFYSKDLEKLGFLLDKDLSYWKT